MDIFLDGPDAKLRDAVHILFANEKVRPDYAIPAPDVTNSTKPGPIQIVSFEPPVELKLTSFQLDDRVDLQDLLEVALIDATWLTRLPAPLAARLQQLLDTPGK